MEKTVSDAIKYRRSIRIFKNIDLDTEQVKNCLINASLAPNSSNLQLWEFIHITDKNLIKRLGPVCMNQNAATTANQLVVFVTRKDLWKKRAESNIKFIKKSFEENPESISEKRKKGVLFYYKTLIPTIYTSFFGILGMLKYLIFQVIGLFRPIYRQTRLSDLRVVAHKSLALAAQNFMISMAAINYDTCPMEGTDTLRVKKILNLPNGAEINMVIGCGIRDKKGLYNKQFRVPFKDIYSHY
jgi:nitroreductase